MHHKLPAKLHLAIDNLTAKTSMKNPVIATVQVSTDPQILSLFSRLGD